MIPKNALIVRDYGLNRDDRSFIDLRPYRWDSSIGMILVAELEVRSGNAQNDGLKLNTALARLTREELELLRDRCDALLVIDEFRR